MFGNISELVPISVAFEKDLRHMADQLSEHRPLPDGFGEMILSHVSWRSCSWPPFRELTTHRCNSLAQVERMEPFRKWLSNHSNADSIRQQLETRNTAFVRFVQSTQAICRDHTQQTAGLAELLAEPFQRVSRYRLMLDRESAADSRDGRDIVELTFVLYLQPSSHIFLPMIPTWNRCRLPCCSSVTSARCASTRRRATLLLCGA